MATRETDVHPFLAVTAPLVLLLPFIDKPFHVDDTVYLWVARHILESPLDFYGFTANWSFLEEPMAQINKNPPGVSYFIAAVVALFGWGEQALHAAFLLPAAAVALGTYLLARRFTTRPGIAALAATLSPVFVVSGTNVMSDTLTLAFYVWAVYWWVEGVESNSRARLIAAALFMALATLTKYLGITSLPLLFAYSVAKKRGIGPWAMYFAIPILIITAYQWYCWRMYAVNPLASAAGFASSFTAEANAAPLSYLSRFMIGLTFLGGCHTAITLMSFALWPRRWTAPLLLVALASACVLFLAFQSASNAIAHPDYGMSPSMRLQCILFAAAGIHLLFCTAYHLYRERDPGALLIFLWIVGMFVFSSFVNWTTNGRTMLPMAPAVGILAARMVPPRAESASLRMSVPIGLAASACLALIVAWSDYAMAGAGKRAGEDLAKVRESLGAEVWVQGNWGMRWYLEEAGAKPFDRNNGPHLGDIVVQSSNNLIYPLPRELRTLEREAVFPVFPWLATMDRRLGAAFYAAIWGPLPYSFGRVAPESFYYWRMQLDTEAIESGPDQLSPRSDLPGSR